jgi:hypothetical protein
VLVLLQLNIRLFFCGWKDTGVVGSFGWLLLLFGLGVGWFFGLGCFWGCGGRHLEDTGCLLGCLLFLCCAVGLLLFVVGRF